MMFLPGAQALFEGSELGPIDFLIDLIDQRLSAAGGRKISFHFGVPRLFFDLLKPFRHGAALSFGKMLDRCFDGFYGHMESLNLLSHECKSE
jgi:hypothetical protein